MKMRYAVLMLAIIGIAWMPADSQAYSLNFSGTVDWVWVGQQGNPPIGGIYVNTYDSHIFSAGKSMTGYVGYTDDTTSQLWMNVADASGSVYHFEASGSGAYYPDGVNGTGGQVFEIQSETGLLTNLILSIDQSGTGTWYVDYDSESPFRIGGSAEVVPIPGAVWLLGSGLVGLMGFRKRFAA